MLAAPTYLSSKLLSLLCRMSPVLFITCLLFMLLFMSLVYCLLLSWPGGWERAASRLLWLCAGWRLFVPAVWPDRCEAAESGERSWTRGPGLRPGTLGGSFRGDQEREETPLVSGIMTWLTPEPGHHQIFRSMRGHGARIKLYLARGQYYSDRISMKDHLVSFRLFHERFLIPLSWWVNNWQAYINGWFNVDTDELTSQWFGIKTLLYN